MDGSPLVFGFGSRHHYLPGLSSSPVFSEHGPQVDLLVNLAFEQCEFPPRFEVKPPAWELP